MSHFTFAYQGHLKSAAGRSKKFLFLYLVLLLISTAALFLLRFTIGYSIFSAIAWIYFISHLLKAEMYFSGA
ncbi:MAG: hypothetical protein ACAH59_02020, partial [Pseudobdellovibrionaceae bacterium]